MKTKSKINGHIIRSGAWAVFLSVAFIAASSASDSPNTWHKSAATAGGHDTIGKISSQSRAFSFAERVAYQRAIEDIYWRHRIWPKENPDLKPALDVVMSQAQLENKIADYLRNSLALEDHGQPITAKQLQAEMDRVAQNTKQPEVLRELFQALGNDPAVIAECLARPILAERLIADLSAPHATQHIESPQSNELLAMSVETTVGQVVYILPEITDTCTDDTWTATTTANAPLARDQHTAVWTGSEMIVWGGYRYPMGYFNTGGRYNPSTDTWTATTITNAPSARVGHTAVWTGSEMVVWGGFFSDAFTGHYLNTGARYNPATNTWAATTTINAPTDRAGHTAVWSGGEMIVWGGGSGGSPPFLLNTGGRYDPGTNRWTATSTTNAPTARDSHTAVWTGSEMIVWGGTGGSLLLLLNTGGRYNPATDNWTATSTTNPPQGRYLHTVVWTGSEMIVWGGYVVERGLPRQTRTGGKYNPSTDSWIVTSRFNAPVRRGIHTAVWTGSEMIVWGGSVVSPPPFNTGGRYNPLTDSWRATSLTNAPAESSLHTAVWTGSEMIVWGGRLHTGGRYCAQPVPPPITIIQPNGGEIWTAGSVQQIRWNSNLRHSDHLIIQYSRDGGASWFRIAQNIPAFTVRLLVASRQFPYHSG